MTLKYTLSLLYLAISLDHSHPPTSLVQLSVADNFSSIFLFRFFFYASLDNTEGSPMDRYEGERRC